MSVLVDENTLKLRTKHKLGTQDLKCRQKIIFINDALAGEVPLAIDNSYMKRMEQIRQAFRNDLGNSLGVNQ